MSKSGIAALGLALACSLGAATGSARGQFYGGYSGTTGPLDNIEGFTVAGKAIVLARPDVVEIDLSVSAGSELTADAIVKYRDARRKLRDAFAALKLSNVAVEERGLLVDQKGSMNNMYFFGGYQPNQRNKTEVQLSRKLVVRGSDIRKMDEDAVLQLVARLLDVAQDAGGHVGPQQEDFNPYYYRWNQQNTGLVRFVLEDFDKLQEEAYEKAIADARTRAERLARLSKVELGPIVAIREIVVPGDVVSNPEEDRPRKRLETSKFQDIPVRVELLVRFEVVTKGNGKGGAAGR
jgi:uncharacterized protein